MVLALCASSAAAAAFIAAAEREEGEEEEEEEEEESTVSSDLTLGNLYSSHLKIKIETCVVQPNSSSSSKNNTTTTPIPKFDPTDDRALYGNSNKISNHSSVTTTTTLTQGP